MPEALLAPFGPGLWVAQGGTVTSAGFRYPTRMAVIRLPGGGLFVWSPVALAEQLQREVGELGDVRFIIAPNSLHHVFVSQWQKAYPSALTFGAPGLSTRQKDVTIDRQLEDAPPPEWSETIDQVVMRGNAITLEVVFFHRESGTVLFTDLIQNFPKGWFKGWQAIVAGLDRMTGREPAVPQKFRLAFVNRRVARTALARILAWPADRVLMAHGPLIDRDGAAFIARAFRWLQR